MEKADIKLIQTIAEEIASAGVWSGHMTSIEYMEEYYEPFLKLLYKASIPCGYFKELHDETKDAFKKVTNWLDETETEAFDFLDLKYFNEFTNLCETITTKFNIELY